MSSRILGPKQKRVVFIPSPQKLPVGGSNPEGRFQCTIWRLLHLQRYIKWELPHKNWFNSLSAEKENWILVCGCEFWVEGTWQPLSFSLIIKFYDVIFLDDSEELGKCKLTQCPAYWSSECLRVMSWVLLHFYTALLQARLLLLVCSLVPQSSSYPCPRWSRSRLNSSSHLNGNLWSTGSCVGLMYTVSITVLP